MRSAWSGLGLLLAVPWLVSCVSRPETRLDTSQGTTVVHTAPAIESSPVRLSQEEFTSALADLVLHMPLSLAPPRREGRVRLASWESGPEQDSAQHLMERQCAPAESPEGCLVLPTHAPPPETLERLRLALSFSMDTVWEGAAVPLREYLDPLALKIMVCTALSTYLLVLMVPEPVTKGLAAVLTLYLVAYLGLGPVWAMARAGGRLLEEAKRASSTEALQEAGHRFGKILGDNGMRVLLLLATAALSGETSFVGKGPGLPGFGRAALAAPARTGVALAAAGQVRSVVLGANQLTVALAPTAVAATAMGSGDGSSPPRKGHLSGRPNKPGANEKNLENLRAAERENESARLLAENGYDVEQGPATNSRGKNPDYKINGQYADCYAPSTDNARSIWQKVAEKVNKGQSDRIVLNLDDSKVTMDALKEQLVEDPIDGLKEVIVIRAGRLALFFP